jgi:hypothetical protein
LSRWLGLGVLALLSCGAPLAVAQIQNDFNQMFGIPQDALVQTATRSEWNKISSTEIGCIDNALHQQGGSVEALIQRGVIPSDTRIGSVRSNCWSQLRQQWMSFPVYAVNGLALGARVHFDSSTYREYKCGSSDQFDSFTWCQKTRHERERRGSFTATYSMLHSHDGTVVYVNRFQQPAYFDSKEANDDIQRYSRKFGGQPRIITMRDRPGLPNGILATWGKVVLEPLDTESLEKLADGRRPTKKGYIIDFIGNFAHSAKEGLPIYRLSGGAGFVWVASYDQKGRGTLRFSAVDASAISSESVATQAPTNPADHPPQATPSTAPLSAITADKVEQRKIAEAKASENLANAPENLQFLMKGLRAADDFIKLAEETFVATFNDGQPEELKNDVFTDARQKPPEIAFRNFRECFFLSDSGCNRSYGILSGVMPTLNPALSEIIAQPELIREFKYEGACFFSASLDIKKSLLQKNSDGSYKKDQTGHVAYFLNFNGINPNSVKIIDAPEYIKIAFEPPRSRPTPKFPTYLSELTNGFPMDQPWQIRYDRFVSSMIEKTSIRKFVIVEKRKVTKFPSAPVNLLLADVGESTDEEPDWNPVNYNEEVQPFAIGRSTLKRFPVLAFESGDADLIAENLSGVIQGCQNDR